MLPDGFRLLRIRHSFEATEGYGQQNGRMAIPETDLLRISRWCRERVPEHLWGRVRVSAEIADRHVTIIETKLPRTGRATGCASRSRTCAALPETANEASTS